MENQKKKRIITPEQKKQRTIYMTNKPWFCSICDNGKDYKLCGKTLHCRTKMHLKNECAHGIKTMNNI